MDQQFALQFCHDMSICKICKSCHHVQRCTYYILVLLPFLIVCANPLFYFFVVFQYFQNDHYLILSIMKIGKLLLKYLQPTYVTSFKRQREEIGFFLQGELMFFGLCQYCHCVTKHFCTHYEIEFQ